MLLEEQGQAVQTRGRSGPHGHAHPYLRGGANTVALEASGRANLAYQVVATHHLPWEGQVQAEDKPLEIGVAYDRTLLETDDLLGCEVRLR